MGKAIIIKNADFSAQGVGQVNFVNYNWMCGIGNKIPYIVSQLSSEQVTSRTAYYFFGSHSPLVFAGKRIVKVACRFISGLIDIESRTITYGVCNKNVASLADYTNSYVEIGTVTIPYNSEGAIVDIPPFTVPEGKTIVFHLNGGVDAMLSVAADYTTSGVAFGVPGLDRYVPDSATPIKYSDAMSLLIDFMSEDVES